MSLHPRYIPRDPLEEQDIVSSVSVIRTKDNAVFLASRIPDVRTKDVPIKDAIRSYEEQDADKPTYATKLASVILPTAAVSISRILNHPNIISLVDIVQNSQLYGSITEAGELGDLTIWEDMSAGSLSYILPSPTTLPAFEDKKEWHLLAAPNPQRFSLPESICWHVLRSISRALLWLHYGYKETQGIPGEIIQHDCDWHAILIMDIGPSQIWFKKPNGKTGETYGECKLGGFQWAKVCGSVNARRACNRRPEDASISKQMFWAPEIYTGVGPGWTRASEIWSLGAVIYNMMTGIPPPRLFTYDWQISRMNDKEFSKWIREIVGDMLVHHPADRPDTHLLVNVIEHGYRCWKEDTEEGRRYVDVADII